MRKHLQEHGCLVHFFCFLVCFFSGLADQEVVAGLVCIFRGKGCWGIAFFAGLFFSRISRRGHREKRNPNKYKNPK